MPRTHDELVGLLRAHVSFMRRSGRLFDRGAEDEALRLSVSVRVLVHDTDRSTSLLRQLGTKGTLTFCDSCIPSPEPTDGTMVWTMGAGLAGLSADASGRPSYVAPLAVHPSSIGEVGFDDWWERVIIRDQDGQEFRRRDLVLGLANQDGGAHVDPDLNAAYEALARSNSLGWWVGVTSPSDSPTRPMGSPVPANVRQIAWELEKSLLGQLEDDLQFLPAV